MKARNILLRAFYVSPHPGPSPKERAVSEGYLLSKKPFYSISTSRKCA